MVAKKAPAKKAAVGKKLPIKKATKASMKMMKPGKAPRMPMDSSRGSSGGPGTSY